MFSSILPCFFVFVFLEEPLCGLEEKLFGILKSLTSTINKMEAGRPKFLFAPWEADSSVFEEAGINYGIDYPKPIVSIEESRDIALKAYDQIKG